MTNTNPDNATHPQADDPGMLLAAHKPSGRLAGRVAFVTGVGSVGPGWGNGKAIAALFAREGAKVFGVDRDAGAAEAGREAIMPLVAEGGDCAVATADVSREADVVAAIEACRARFGAIDVLVNNVGIVRLDSITEIDEAEWDRVFAINVKSAYLTAKHILPEMARNRRGAVVNIASIAAIRYTGVPYITYYATKSAMLGLTRGIALEYAAQGIRANAVLPGLMDTPMVTAGLTSAYATQGDVAGLKQTRATQCPTGRMGDAYDVATACLYLASAEAKYVTGAELVVDGGITQKYS
jgi:NAD(P)-dependent dehydrogenase (short-subunit alcohol dehydrogenase family)